MSAEAKRNERRRSAKEWANRLLSVLLAVAMVTQSSPFAFAYEQTRTGFGQDAQAQPVETTVEDAAVPGMAAEPNEAPDADEHPAGDAMSVDDEAPTEDRADESREGEPDADESEDDDAEAEAEDEQVDDDDVTDAQEVADDEDEEAFEEVAIDEQEDEVEEQEPVAMIAIPIALYHSSLTYNGHTVVNVTGTLSIPEDQDAIIDIVAEQGYRIRAITLATAAGDEVLGEADGTYVLTAEQVAVTESLTVTSERIPTKTTYEYEDTQLRAIAAVDDPEAIPDEAQLFVIPVTERSPYYNYDAYMAALNGGEGDAYNASNTLLYDVAFLMVDPETGETVEVQPAEGPVRVTFEFKQDQLVRRLDAASAADVEVTHLPVRDDAKAETTWKTTDITDGDVMVEPIDGADLAAAGTNVVQVRAASFSVYAFSYRVDFVYGGFEYSLNGEDSVLLSRLFGALGIAEPMDRVRDVIFSDPSLLQVERVQGDWELTSLGSFATDELLTVTMLNGATYEIRVTDPPDYDKGDYDAKGTAELFATKILNGRAIEEGEFSFRLEAVDGANMPKAADRDGSLTVKNDADGKAAFGTIGFSLADLDQVDEETDLKYGEFSYVITEVFDREGLTENEDGTFTDPETGMTYDRAEHKVTVRVSDDGHGKLVATYDGEDTFAGADFTNAYYGAVADFDFDTYLYGAESGNFTFLLTAAADESGEARGGEAPQKEPEEKGEARGDEALQKRLNKRGQLEDDGSAFEYEMAAGSKGFAGGVAKVAIPQLLYHKPGTYYYTIIEEGGVGFAGDTATILLKVEATEKKDHTAAPSAVSYKMIFEDGSESEWVAFEEGTERAEFYNNAFDLGVRQSRYFGNQTVGEQTAFYPKVLKSLPGATLEGGEFSFTLYDADGNAIETETNDKNGVVSFGAIEYDKDDANTTFTYTVEEVIPDDAVDGVKDGIVYSTEVVTITVAVTETDGAISAEGTYSVDGRKVADDKVATITNHLESLRVKVQKRTRLYNDDGTVRLGDPVAGARYRMYMVSENGEDVDLGLGRSQPEPEGAQECSNEDGYLWYDVPSVEGVAFYFREEGPAPAGHLIDPYRTDYFTLRRTTGGLYELVYEYDSDFQELTGVTPTRS